MSTAYPKLAKPIRVAIVGGGIGGLALAAGIIRHSHLDVHVYEAAHKFSEIGAGISIGPNAQQALELLGSDAQKAFSNVATYNLSPEYKDVFVEIGLGSGPHVGQHVTTLRNRTGNCTTHRAHFLDEFVKLIPPERAHFGKRLERVEDLGSDGVRMYFKDGTTEKADCVIGAEGIHSTTRAYILGSQHPMLKPTFSKFVAFRALVPMNEALEVLDERVAKNSMLHLGTGSGIFHYPVTHGDILNIIVMRHQDSWDDEKWIVPVDHQAFEDLYKDWDDQSRKLISLANRPGFSKWALWDLPPAPTFHKGRVIMMGDAAHATTPFHGQGAGQAVEDALILAKLLEQVKSPERLDSAFAAYNSVRRERSLRNTKTSREDGELWSPQKGDLLDNPEELKKAFDPSLLWLWERDMRADVKLALEQFTSF